MSLWGPILIIVAGGILAVVAYVIVDGAPRVERAKSILDAPRLPEGYVWHDGDN